MATAAGASRGGIMAGRPLGAAAWRCFSPFLRACALPANAFHLSASWVSPQIAAHMTNSGKQQDVVQMDAILPTHRQPVGVGGDMSVGEAQHSHPRLGAFGRSGHTAAISHSRSSGPGRGPCPQVLSGAPSHPTPSLILSLAQVIGQLNNRGHGEND